MFRTIECSQIDFEDTYFLMSYPLELEKILKSVGMVGVLQPIIVSGCPCHEGYRIVAGFRRAYACRKIGINSVHAHICQVKPEESLGAFWLTLSENASHRAFNDVEKSLILTKLVGQFQCSRDDVIRNYMPILELAPNAKVLNIYLKIADFEEEIKHYIATHELPMSLFELLANLASVDRTAVFTLISTLKLGVNKIKELLIDLDEIALRDGCSIYQVLDDKNIQEILTHKRYSGPQKAEHVRRIIRKKRYPQLTDLEHKYKKRLKQLQLPRGLQLKTDRFFEDDELSASFRFQTPEQLEAFAKELLHLSQKPELQDLLDLIQGKQ
jgi:ParB-like chromosome segregation protein Spo0J